MQHDVRKIKEDLIEAGKEAAIDLINVAKEKIVLKKSDSPSIAADKLKNAAAAKKMAIFDGFDILDRVQLENDKLLKEDENAGKNPEEQVKTDFKSAEERRG